MRMILCLAAIAIVLTSGIPGRSQEGPASPASINASSSAAVPRLIRFNGTLRQVGEQPTRGAVELSFSLFKEESGGEPLWFESQTVEVDAQGRYNVLLGAMHPDGLPMDLFTSGEARWLSIMVGKAEQPRVLLVSVPYALKAADAESLGGKPATAFVASEQLKEEVAAAMADPKYAQRALNTIVARASSGSDTPPALINESVPATFTCTSASNCILATQNGTGHAVRAQSMAASGATYGVYGTSASTSGRGVFGHATATTGVNYGVRGQTSSTSGYGMYGLASALTGVTHGLAGSSASTSGRGIFGDASAATGATFGILGQAASTSGVGLLGSATAASGLTIGVRALVNSASGIGAVIDNLGGGKLISARTTGFAERFSVDGNGNVVASGSVTAPTGSFAGGVHGVSASGYGVEGNSPSNIGVAGFGGLHGVYGYSTNTAVYGVNGGTGPGVSGYSLTYSSSGSLGTQDGFGVGTGVSSVGYYGVRTTGYWRGVYATSTEGYGVYGTGPIAGVYGSGTTFGIGVHGYTPSGYGVYGTGDNGVRGECFSGDGCTGVVGVGGSSGVGVYGASSGGYGVYSEGDTGASGTKSAVVALADKRVVELYAVESTEVWFEDFGSVVMTNGIAHVTLDPTFELTVNTGSNYYVFLTPNGDTNGLYVAQKSPNGFQIRESRGGRSDITVDYRIVAKRRGFEHVRLQEVDADEETVAAVRTQNRARVTRPKLKLPRKIEVPSAPVGGASAGAQAVSPAAPGQ